MELNKSKEHSQLGHHEPKENFMSKNKGETKMAETTKQLATKKTQGKELKLDFIRMCQERNERFKREEKAREYCAKVSRRKEKKRQAMENIITNVVCIVIIVVGLSLGLSLVNVKGSAKQSSIYTMQGELQGNHVVLSDGNAHEVSKEYANYTSEPRKVTVVLNDNGTEEVTDDIILDIR